MAYQYTNNNNNNYYYNTIMQKKQQLQPTNILNSIFKSTLNMASKMLLSVVSNNNYYAFDFSSPSFVSNYGVTFAKILTKNTWKFKDHLTFISLLISWFTMWALRLVTDFFPSSRSLFHRFFSSHLSNNNNNQLISRYDNNPSNYYYNDNDNDNDNDNLVRQKCFIVDDGVGEGSFSAVGSTPSSSSSSMATITSASLDLVAASSSTSSSLSSSSWLMYSPSIQNNVDLISHDGFLVDGYDHHPHAGQSVEALGRALSHILALLNELPVTSRKYEFAIAMADRLLDENTRDANNVELLHVNRVALSSAFGSTVNRLHEALNNADQANNSRSSSGPWTMRMIRKLPLGTYITAYMKGGLRAVFPALQSSSVWQLKKRRSLMSGDGDRDGDGYEGSDDRGMEVVGAEKLAQELLWIIHKLRACHAVDEALVQWGLASDLSSLALNANPRVQALLMKVSASLLGDVARAGFKVHTQVQYRLLVLWLPLFCYASNGLRYPALSSYEKIDVERTMERMIASLSAMEQEIVLRNWLQDFAICSSDWPNLRPSYDRWCQFSRQLVT